MLLDGILPQHVVFWSGAGISRDEPTALPTGPELVQRAFDSYFEAETQKVIATLVQKLEFDNPKVRPRLETLLDVASDVYSPQVLLDVLSDALLAVPNRNHLFFAQHLTRGGGHITTNFDSCIESAISKSIRPNSPHPIHFHGEIKDEHSVETLGARLKIIQMGIDKAMVRRLKDNIDHPNSKILYFVGYSGSDYFDATPFLVEHLAKSSVDRIYVHMQPHSDGTPDTSWQQDHSNLFYRLQESGIHFEIMDAPLTNLVLELSNRWGFQSEAPIGTYRRHWTRTTDLSENQNERASAKLYSILGFTTAIIKSSEGVPPKGRKSWEGLATAFWGKGRYQEALAAWRCAYPGETDEERILLKERELAIKWIRGELLSAQRGLWTEIALDFAKGHRPKYLASIGYLVTYGRVLEHMQRAPDAKPFINRRQKKRLEELVQQILNDDCMNLDWATRSNLSDLLRKQGIPTEISLQTNIVSFSESDSFNAVLNFRHADLANRLASSELKDSVTKADLEKQRDFQNALGATADAARVFLLPGATNYYSPREMYEAFAPIEMSTWNRIRYVLGFSVLWLYGRIKNL